MSKSSVEFVMILTENWESVHGNSKYKVWLLDIIYYLFYMYEHKLTAKVIIVISIFVCFPLGSLLDRLKGKKINICSYLWWTFDEQCSRYKECGKYKVIDFNKRLL